MKRTELAISALLVPLDFCMLVLAAWAAFQLRFLDVVEGIRPVLFELSLGAYLQSAAVVAMVWIVIFAFAGLYVRRATDTWVSEIGRVFFACSAGLVSITVLVFLRGELFSSRFIILAAWVLAMLFVALARLLVRGVQRVVFQYGYGAHRLVVVGDGHVAQEIIQSITEHPELGYRLAAHVAINEAGLATVQRLAEADEIDELLFAAPEASVSERLQFWECAEDHHLIFRYAPDMLLSPVGQVSITFDLGVPLAEVHETTLQGWGRVVKRAIDIVGALIGLVAFSPFLVVVAIAVVLDSGRPILYRNIRIARGKPFAMYKFRSMKQEFCTGDAYGGATAEKLEEQLIAERNVRQGPVPKIVDDPRWTRVGKWIRRLSLDELPQFWNVLEGDMSLVGPRPHVPKEIARYERHHRKVLAVKPGITGLAQVSGRSDLHFEDEVRLDRYYIEHWSVPLDMRILAKTFVAVLRRRDTL